MKKLLFVLLIGMVMAFTSCEKMDDIKEVATTTQSALKSVENPYWPDPQMSHHPTYTLSNSSADFFSYEDVPPYLYTYNWHKIAGSSPAAYLGARYLSTGGYGGYSWRLDTRGTDWFFNNSLLFRVVPNLDPSGYDGHVGFMVRGPEGVTAYLGVVIACADEDGPANIIPDNDEEDDFNWLWSLQDGVYISYIGDQDQVTFTGDWQWVQCNVANQWWDILNDNPGVAFDQYPPYDDDVYVWFLRALNNQTAYDVDFNWIVNGEVSYASPIPSGTYAVNGENNVHPNQTYTYTFEGGAPFNDYEWSTSPGKAQIMSGQGTNTAQIKILSTGNVFIYCKGKYNQMGWSSNKALLLSSEETTPPPTTPPAPTITGASSLSGYLPIVSSYSQPTGKEAYEWILPYGTYSVQQYNNIKVIGFSSSGNRTIQGRYKENGVWSYYGYKSVYVSGY